MCHGILKRSGIVYINLPPNISTTRMSSLREQNGYFHLHYSLFRPLVRTFPIKTYYFIGKYFPPNLSYPRFPGRSCKVAHWCQRQLISLKTHNSALGWHPSVFYKWAYSKWCLGRCLQHSTSVTLLCPDNLSVTVWRAARVILVNRHGSPGPEKLSVEVIPTFLFKTLFYHKSS